MLKLSRVLSPAFLLLMVIACDRPDCTNTNPIFDQYLPESEEYKTGLTNHHNPPTIVFFKTCDEEAGLMILQTTMKQHGRPTQPRAVLQ
jgi:hypothetical protein